MKKRVADKFWFPWWPDKWIFGSVRIECTPAERGIWVDLLSLASKDDGHIRANEETPYPLQQLSGMLIIPENELDSAIKKFIKTKKLTKEKSGTLYVTKWDKYQFSDRHKRRIEEEMTGKKDTIAGKKDTILNKSTLNNNKIKNIKNNMSEKKPDDVEKSFEILWKDWPKEGRFKKKYCLMKFKALCKQGLKEKFRATTIGYHEYLKHKKLIENFDQKCMHLSTWMNNWEGEKQYIGFEYKPKL